MAYERADWEAVQHLAGDLPVAALADIYTEAVAWGDIAIDDELLEVLDDFGAEGYRLVLVVARATQDRVPRFERMPVLKFDVRVLGLDETVRQAGLVAPLRLKGIACQRRA